MVVPEVGSKAPDFRLSDTKGRAWTLADLAGHNLVLYFFPKADTPGCTRESCGFRDRSDEFAAAGVTVVGVSPDSHEQQAQFVERHAIPFPVLSDPDHKVAERFGVWKEKSMYGKRFWGIERTTFLIAPDGRILKTYPRVRVNGHVDKVLADTKGLVATV